MSPWTLILWVCNPGEGIDEIFCRNLPSVMEFDTFSQKEDIGETIRRNFPGFGNGRDDIEILVELNKAIEQLLDNCCGIKVSRHDWIQCPGH
jgi:hypothetical protein